MKNNLYLQNKTLRTKKQRRQRLHASAQKPVQWFTDFAVSYAVPVSKQSQKILLLWRP